MLNQIESEKEFIMALFTAGIMMKGHEFELYEDDFIFALGAAAKFFAEIYAHNGEGTIEDCISRVKNNFIQGFDSLSYMAHFPKRTGAH